MPGHRKFFLLFMLIFSLFLLAFQPVYAKEKSAYDEPNFEIEIGGCVWNGTTSITQVTFKLTNTKAQVYLPSGSYFPLTMSNPIVTVGLESGTYNYVWWDDFDPVFYTWKTRVEGSFILEECRPKASASVTVGTCSWTVENGSVTPVTITLDHASLTLNGIVYTQPRTIVNDLEPGTYFYSWTGINGYEGGGSNLTLTIPDCTPLPATVTVNPDTCEWDQENGSTTDVTLTIAHASLVISGPSGAYGPFTSNAVLTLEQGHYTYSWTAQSGYTGSGSGSFDLSDCEPEYGTASIQASACSWDETQGSTFNVAITLENATLTINKTTYQDSTSIQLACGTYSYTWSAKTGYQGGGSGSISVEGCEPTSANVVVGTCGWNGQTSITPVVININGATLTLFKFDAGALVEVDQFGPGTHTINLPIGAYSYNWVANENFTGSGNGTFETLDCKPGKADASINAGACSFENGKSLTLVSINVSGAVLSINGCDYSENDEIKLEPGEYSYSWEAVSGFEGSGVGTIVIEGCEPAAAVVVLGACTWMEENSITSVVLNIHGATLTLFVDDGITLTQTGEYGPGSYTVDLPRGSYSYSWAANKDFTGSGEGTFETLGCEPGKADASISIGACTYIDGRSLTVISITVNGAILSINEQEFIGNTELKLEPGVYPYFWIAAGDAYRGEGEGVLTVENCEPKGYEDPDPDVAAGGNGPSVKPLLLITPVVIIILVIFRLRENNTSKY